MFWHMLITLNTHAYSKVITDLLILIKLGNELILQIDMII